MVPITILAFMLAIASLHNSIDPTTIENDKYDVIGLLIVGLGVFMQNYFGESECFQEPNQCCLVLFHEYGRVLGVYIMDIWWYYTHMVIYVQSGLYDHFDSHISLFRPPLLHFRSTRGHILFYGINIWPFSVWWCQKIWQLHKRLYQECTAENTYYR